MQGIVWCNEKEINSIHEESLKLIEDIGFKLDDINLLNRLKEFDVKIDETGKNIKVPVKVSQYFLGKVPKKIKLFGIDPKHDIELGNQRFYRPISGAISIVDNYLSIRKPLRKDVKDIATIVQNLDFMHINATAIHPFDVPGKFSDVTAAKICFENCSKHIMVDTLNEESFEIILEMAFKISGSEKAFRLRPFFQVHFPAVSPFTFDHNACANLKLATKYNIPIRVGSSPMSGGNSPIKLAGTLLLMNTEIIFGVIIAQMLNEGHPAIYGAAPTLLEMKYGTMSWGAPEHAKMAAISAGLAHKFNLFSTTTGFATDSKISDQQAVFEKTMNSLLAALSGVDILAGAGLLEGELTYDAAQLIIDNEIAKYIENIFSGIEISKESMSVELIKKIGIGGDFLSTEQTLNLYKTEHETFELLDRSSRNSWDVSGGKDMYKRAKKIAEDLIINRSQCLLPDKISARN
ncbi:MAG: trimethylamine methyltransferase family protein [Actinobacteria bacterium]|nr:trimethylamine methyltransferase family protein [Actinomycetota bacterium]